MNFLLLPIGILPLFLQLSGQRVLLPLQFPFVFLKTFDLFLVFDPLLFLSLGHESDFLELNLELLFQRLDHVFVVFLLLQIHLGVQLILIHNFLIGQILLMQNALQSKALELAHKFGQHFSLPFALCLFDEFLQHFLEVSQKFLNISGVIISLVDFFLDLVRDFCQGLSILIDLHRFVYAPSDVLLFSHEV